MEYEAMGGESVRIMKTLCTNMYRPTYYRSNIIYCLTLLCNLPNLCFSQPKNFIN